MGGIFYLNWTIISLWSDCIGVRAKVTWHSKVKRIINEAQILNLGTKLKKSGQKTHKILMVIITDCISI